MTNQKYTKQDPCENQSHSGNKEQRQSSRPGFLFNYSYKAPGPTRHTQQILVPSVFPSSAFNLVTVEV